MTKESDNDEIPSALINQTEIPHSGSLTDILIKWLIVVWMILYSGFTLYAVTALWLSQGNVLCDWLATSDCSNLPGVFISGVYAMLGGILGAGVLGMAAFHQHASMEGNFEIRHGWGYLFAPLLAAILGLIVFALMQSGLLVFSGASNSDPSPVVNFGYLSIGFLSGFGWYPATQRIHQIVMKFFSLKEESPEAESHQKNGD